MVKQRHEHGPPMDLGNMRRQGIRHLIGFATTMPAAIKL